jgi:hypothetical protein
MRTFTKPGSGGTVVSGQTAAVLAQRYAQPAAANRTAVVLAYADKDAITPPLGTRHELPLKPAFKGHGLRIARIA